MDKDIHQFIAHLQSQLANMNPEQRQKMIAIIKDLVKLAQDKPKGPLH